MIKDSSESKSSQLLDPIVLARIEQASKICLLAASLVAAIILSGWFLPVISSFFPDGWALMQASTAFMILFISIALALNRYKSDDRYAFMSLFFAFLCLFLVGATLSEHWYGEGAIMGRYLVANEMRSLVGSTSVQSVSCFFLLTVPLFIDPSRQDKRGWLLDFFHHTPCYPQSPVCRRAYLSSKQLCQIVFNESSFASNPGMRCVTDICPGSEAGSLRCVFHRGVKGDRWPYCANPVACFSACFICSYFQSNANQAIGSSVFTL